MNICLVRNLAPGPRDYPLRDGSSIYLASKGSPQAITGINPENISAILKEAEEKGLIALEYTDIKPAGEAEE